MLEKVTTKKKETTTIIKIVLEIFSVRWELREANKSSISFPPGSLLKGQEQILSLVFLVKIICSLQKL